LEDLDIIAEDSDILAESAESEAAKSAEILEPPTGAAPEGPAQEPRALAKPLAGPVSEEPEDAEDAWRSLASPPVDFSLSALDGPHGTASDAGDANPPAAFSEDLSAGLPSEDSALPLFAASTPAPSDAPEALEALARDASAVGAESSPDAPSPEDAPAGACVGGGSADEGLISPPESSLDAPPLDGAAPLFAGALHPLGATTEETVAPPGSPLDAPPEAPSDVFPNSPFDVILEASLDFPPDSLVEAPPEAPVDLSPDAPLDATPQDPLDASLAAAPGAADLSLSKDAGLKPGSGGEGSPEGATPKGSAAGDAPLKELLEGVLKELPLEELARDSIYEGLAAVAWIVLQRGIGVGGAFSGEEDLAYFVDALVSELDRTLSLQLDEVIHHRDFQNLERLWLSLKFLANSVNFQENVKIDILNVKKSELYYDLSDVPEISRSAIYRVAYAEEYGQFGGQPYAAILGAYEFDHSPPDLFLLRSLSALGAISHAPFIAGASASFFGARDFKDLSEVLDVTALFESVGFAPYRELRLNPNSRYLALTLPGFLARLPYSPVASPVSAFNYAERSEEPDRDFAWGHSSFLLVARLADSFARTRFCVDIVGTEGGGLVTGLPALPYESFGGALARFSTQALIGETLENQLAKAGFIPLSAYGAEGAAVFHGAQTVLSPAAGGERGAESFNYRVSTMLPYMMIVNRLAHYIKVLQRENIGTWKDSVTLEREINAWLNQYVTDMDSPSPDIRGRRPLRFAQVEVRDLPDSPGWRHMVLKIRPHLKFMGANFTLTLQGRLDQVDFQET
jgi:type VI secretion system protein ImpC